MLRWLKKLIDGNEQTSSEDGAYLRDKTKAERYVELKAKDRTPEENKEMGEIFAEAWNGDGSLTRAISEEQRVRDAFGDVEISDD